MTTCPHCGRPVEVADDHYDGFVREWGCTPVLLVTTVCCGDCIQGQEHPATDACAEPLNGGSDA